MKPRRSRRSSADAIAPSGSLENVAEPLAHYAPFRRAGDFLFISGVIAVDPSAARVIRGYGDVAPAVAQLLGRTNEYSVDCREGPIRTQSWYILDRIRNTVEGEGGAMSDVIKLVQFFRNLDDFPPYSRVRKLFFENQPPASTVVGVSEMLPTADILVEVEAIAYLPSRKHFK